MIPAWWTSSLTLGGIETRRIFNALGLMQEPNGLRPAGLRGIDAHANRAPDHESIQGRQYSDAAYTALNSSFLSRSGFNTTSGKLKEAELKVSTLEEQ